MRDHVVHAVVPPRRHPPDVAIDRVERGLTQRLAARQLHRVEVDEPLRRRQEDHRVVAAPAVRVLVRERLAVPQPPARLQRLDDVRVRVEDALAAKQLDVVEEMPRRPDRRVDLQAVFHAGLEVVGAVARRGVHGAGAGVERHVAAEHAERGPRVERMLKADVLQLLALHAGDRRAKRLARRGRDVRRERFGDDHRAAVDVVRRVVELRMKRDRQIRRNRPRRRRPDEDRDAPAGERRHAPPELRCALRRERELDVDRRRRVVLVLDFGLGERGAAVDAPVHRLLALVDEPLLDELAQRARDRRLVLEVHRQIRRVPRREDPEALELLAHDADEALGVRAARAAEFRGRHLALLRPELAVDSQLDRQAVAVVADDVRRVEAGHRSRLDDDLLEDLVERGPHVDVAVRVRRSVVEDELRRACALRANLPVEVDGLPAGERLGLARGQIRLHREVGARQVDRVFPLRHGYPPIL